MFKNLTKYPLLVAPLLVGLAVSACSSDNKKLPVLDENAVSAAGGYISVAKTQGVRPEKIEKLVIPAFNVTYKLKLEGTAIEKIKEGEEEKIKSTEMKVNLENVDITLLQRLTNKAYEDFVEEMKKAKFEVVSIADVAKSEAYHEVNHKEPVTSISIEDDMVTLVPDGLKYYDPDEKIDPEGSFLMGVANINSAVNGNLVAEFGGVEKGVAVLNVNIMVQPGNFDLEEHRVSYLIPFNPSFTVVDDETSIELITDFKAVSMPGRLFYIPKESASYVLNQKMGSETTIIEGMLNVTETDNSAEYNATLYEDGFYRLGAEQLKRVSELMAKAVLE